MIVVRPYLLLCLFICLMDVLSFAVMLGTVGGGAGIFGVLWYKIYDSR